MYQNLGIYWASSVPTFLALVCLLAPLFFYKRGAVIQARCLYAVESEARIRSTVALETDQSYQVRSYHDASRDGVPSIKEARPGMDTGRVQDCQVENGID